MNPNSTQIDRRTAIKLVIAASAALQLPASIADEIARTAAGIGYGKDPDLLIVHEPGKLWPLTLNAAQRSTAAALSDLIIPAEGDWPAASSLGAVEFVDEWISAPYPQMSQDRPLIVDGLAWLESEAQRRYQQTFPDLTLERATRICDDICPGPNVKPEYERTTAFFVRFRQLAAAAYYTTPQGMRDIGYVGNIPLARYEGPPAEVLKKIGLA